jgi:DNA-binding transcriptional MerR regulator
MPTITPDKLYFKIGEVCNLTELKPSVLRFWETEFPALKPVKSGTGQRLYSRKDVELVHEIKRLLYTEKMTIAGTRRKLSRRRQPENEGPQPREALAVLTEVREGLLELKKLLY